MVFGGGILPGCGPPGDEAQRQMEWLIPILIAVGFAALLGKAPSAVHDPVGYNKHQGCMAILSIVFFMGIVMWAVKGCH